MSLELKIKSKHLSVEAKIIRFEEHKLAKTIDWLRNHNQDDAKPWAQKMSLAQHRKWDVRNENRATFLARAYIAGTPYASVEAKRKPEKECIFVGSVLPRVAAMVAKYQPNPIAKQIWDRTKGGYITNPQFQELTSKIQLWATLA